MAMKLSCWKIVWPRKPGIITVSLQKAEFRIIKPRLGRF